MSSFQLLKKHSSLPPRFRNPYHVRLVFSLQALHIQTSSEQGDGPGAEASSH